MKKYQLFTILFALAISIYSCGKKDPIPGPQGPAGKDLNINSNLKDGYVKGKLYSTGKDGKDTLLGEFNYQYLLSTDASSYKRGNSPYISITRQDSAEVGSNFYLYSNIDITADTIKPEQTFINFAYVKDLGNGKYLKFGEALRFLPIGRTSVGTPWQESTFSISNYSFNHSNGKLSFDFEIFYVADETLSRKKAKVIGSLDVNLKEIIFLRTGNLNN
ncbi:hypothetical protein [Sporocytophaga myxococcoides]|uniref:hypothetical protein n=1 Tax=Sporocytophaga myxococcoides TaxID=153721 RepID=UPI0004192A1A|nr:hypothetical protein [Sporocytophaga myxococcoides]